MSAGLCFCLCLFSCFEKYIIKVGSDDDVETVTDTFCPRLEKAEMFFNHDRLDALLFRNGATYCEH